VECRVEEHLPPFLIDEGMIEAHEGGRITKVGLGVLSPLVRRFLEVELVELVGKDGCGVGVKVVMFLFEVENVILKSPSSIQGLEQMAATSPSLARKALRRTASHGA
jgi:hypothetical protein